MTLHEWESLNGAEATAWHARLRRTQSQHERGQITYGIHLALCGQFNDWLGEKDFLGAWEASKP